MTKQSGFSIVELVITLVVVLAAGFGGWYVWQKNHKDDTAAQNTASKQTQDKQNAKQQDKSPKQAYILIKEWDIRIPVSADLSADADYGIYNSNSGEEIIYFISKKLVEKAPSDSYCLLRQAKEDEGRGMYGGTFALGRTKEKPELFNAQSFYVEATGYWYTPGASKGGPCYEGDDGSWGAFNAQLSTAVKQLQPIK